MALLGSAFHTFGATGIREDLEEVISLISPTDTPLYSTLKGGKAAGTYHEWQTDKLASAADNAKLEGDIFTNLVATRSPTDRIGNRVQVFAKAFTITDTMKAVKTAGRGDEGAYQLGKAMKEIKNDCEFALFYWSSNATAGTVGDTTTARHMKSMHGWVSQVTGNTGYSGVTALTITGVMTGLGIAESTFNLILQDIWDEGGKPNAVYLGGYLKRLLSGWGTSTSRVWDGSKKIVNAVDVYESDFNVLSLKLERHAASSIGYILDESLWGKATLIPMGLLPQGRRGLGDDYLLRGEWTVVAYNPTGNGMFISG